MDVAGKNNPKRKTIATDVIAWTGRAGLPDEPPRGSVLGLLEDAEHVKEEIDHIEVQVHGRAK